MSLISDIVEYIDTQKVFTKLDLQWGYNNIWIKERDKWKTIFTTVEGLDILWTQKFSNNVPNDDEQDSSGLD